MLTCVGCGETFKTGEMIRVIDSYEYDGQVFNRGVHADGCYSFDPTDPTTWPAGVEVEVLDSGHFRIRNTTTI